jgi:formylglycine-generating enzyme required for sulfatase activity
VRNFHGFHDLPLNEPVSHISFYEANAFAKWSNKRLPTEAECEFALRRGEHPQFSQKDFSTVDVTPELGNLFDNHHWGVIPVGSFPAGKTTDGCFDMLGNVWEWTNSDYAPYPHFSTYFNEYNDKWFVNQKVLRGGSFATPAIHIRPTYRNFFHAEERWMIAGVRLARSL